MANTPEERERFGRRCVICGDTLVPPQTQCPRCLVPYHTECWEWFGGCAVYGCVDPGIVPPDRFHLLAPPPKAELKNLWVEGTLRPLSGRLRMRAHGLDKTVDSQEELIIRRVHSHAVNRTLRLKKVSPESLERAVRNSLWEVLSSAKLELPPRMQKRIVTAVLDTIPTRPAGVAPALEPGAVYRSQVLPQSAADRKEEDRLWRFKQEVRRRVVRSLIGPSFQDQGDQEEVAQAAREAIVSSIREVSKEWRINFSEATRVAIIKEIHDDTFGLGPIEAYFCDPEVTEILVKGTEQIRIHKNGEIEATGRTFRDDAHLVAIIRKILDPLNLRITVTSPKIEKRLKDGTVIIATIPPGTPEGPTLMVLKEGHHTLETSGGHSSSRLEPGNDVSSAVEVAPSPEGPVGFTQIICNTCAEDVEADSSKDCPRCGTPYHPECWADGGGCIVPTCRGEIQERPGDGVGLRMAKAPESIPTHQRDRIIEAVRARFFDLVGRQNEDLTPGYIELKAKEALDEVEEGLRHPLPLGVRKDIIRDLTAGLQKPKPGGW